jgi:hypothetical protein
MNADQDFLTALFRALRGRVEAPAFMAGVTLSVAKGKRRLAREAVEERRFSAVKRASLNVAL